MVTETAPDAGPGVESLDDLVGAAQALEQPAPAPGEPTPQAQAAQAQADNAAELLAAAQLIRAMVLPVVRDPHKRAQLAAVWTDPVLTNAAQAGAAVLDLHGLRMSDVMGRYGPYIALAAALGPPAVQTVVIIRAPAPEDTPADGQQ